ncbi:response regulator transcription factor [Cryptosporangium japonicum]|uniref:Response regulator transcription factor n=1 Tax=Cryptosporangium japonicum TaxID=80872 RepID=A0ABP3E0G1_9ACTN
MTGAEASSPITVVLADDHLVVRRGLAALLQTLPGISVVGEADNGRDVLAEVAHQRPDVVVMDLRMPVLDGVEATRAIVRGHPGTAVLVLTMFSEDTQVAAALRAGARGYLLKTATQSEIEHAIRAVAAGQVILSGDVAGGVLRAGADEQAPGPFGRLSARERQVLDLLAGGASNASIAGALYLSQKTVANHLSSVYQKLGVASRSEAIVLARDAGLGNRG